MAEIHQLHSKNQKDQDKFNKAKHLIQELFYEVDSEITKRKCKQKPLPARTFLVKFSQARFLTQQLREKLENCKQPELWKIENLADSLDQKVNELEGMFHTYLEREKSYRV